MCVEKRMFFELQKLNIYEAGGGRLSGEVPNITLRFEGEGERLVLLELYNIIKTHKNKVNREFKTFKFYLCN